MTMAASLAAPGLDSAASTMTGRCRTSSPFTHQSKLLLLGALLGLLRCCSVLPTHRTASVRQSAFAELASRCWHMRTTPRATSASGLSPLPFVLLNEPVSED